MSQLGQAAPTPLLLGPAPGQGQPLLPGLFWHCNSCPGGHTSCRTSTCMTCASSCGQGLYQSPATARTALQLQPQGSCSAGTRFASHRQNASHVQTGSGTSRAAPVLTQGSAVRSQSHIFLSSIYLNSSHLIAAATAHIFGTYLTK